MQSLDLLFFYQCIHMHMGYIYIYICLAQSVDGCVRVVDLIQHLPNEIFIFRVTNVSETGHHIGVGIKFGFSGRQTPSAVT